MEFREGDSIYGLPKVSPCREFGGILPQNSFKIEVLGNGISHILRPSQCVIKFHRELDPICPSITRAYMYRYMYYGLSEYVEYFYFPLDGVIVHCTVTVSIYTPG